MPENIRHEFRLVIENIPDRRRDATSVAWWNLVRQLALDLKLKSLKDLASVEVGKLASPEAAAEKRRVEGQALLSAFEKGFNSSRKKAGE